MSIMTDDYELSLAVTTFHRTPRFGHTSTFAHFFSGDTDDQKDYAKGVATFGIFLMLLLTVWLLCLLWLKLILGRDRIGWAAGGGPIRVNEIKKQSPTHRLKPILSQMVRRSWRIQSVFLLAAIMLPVATALFLYKGLGTMVHALDNIQHTNQDIERVAYRSIGIVDSLIQERHQLVALNAANLFDIQQHCPRLFLITDDNTTLLFQNISIARDGAVTSQLLTATLNDMGQLVDDTVVYAKSGLTSVSTMTEQVDEYLDYFFANDWIPKLYLVALNVVTFFFMGGVILSRNNTIHYPFRCLLVWFLVPLFIALLSAVAVGTSGMGMAASINADFCAGSSGIAGPKGTLEDIILSNNITKDDLSYRSFDYYMNACTTDNPFQFVVDYMPQLRDTIRQANDFLKLAGELTVEGMSHECGADAGPLIQGVQQLVASLDTVHANIESALVISDCATISPIVRGIFHGSSCKEAVDGLAWMFGTTLAISLLGLALVTLRAALYNATIRKAARSRPEATQREFREYKRYMTQYYNDALMWKHQPDEKANGGLELAPSFDTGITATSTFDKHDDASSSCGSDFIDDDDYIRDDDQDDDNYEDYSDDDSLEVQFKTPCKQQSHDENNITFVDQVKTAEKLRDMLHVLDDELQPLSPPPSSQLNSESPSCTNAPMTEHAAPQKFFKSLQRTTQR